MLRTEKIIIVGAGVFGLSSAFHLARRGYKDIHLYDAQPYHKNGYACSEGCDAASADENKVLRASYGKQKLYQDLAFEAMTEWQRWDELLLGTPTHELPPSMRSCPTEKLWTSCGLLRLSSNGLEPWETETQNHFPPDLKHTQYRISNEQRRKDARIAGVPESKLDPFHRLARSLPMDGMLDMTAGFARASNACAFALHLCRTAGVNLHLGSQYRMASLIRKGSNVTGFVAVDGTRHTADLTIIACGGWSPSLVPEVERLVQTTAGTVVSIRLPQDRHDLWEKYAPHRWPVWTWNMTSYNHEDNRIAGIFGFPRTPDGVVKLCFTGAEWTHFTHKSATTGKTISFPSTNITEVPEEGMRALRLFCEENMPDLLELEPETLRLCWYAETADSSFIIDYVPNTTGLMVCSGGSGHGFKFLPVLGAHVVDVVERKDTDYARLFQWRDVPNGKQDALDRGRTEWWALDKQKMVGKEQWRSSSS